MESNNNDHEYEVQSNDVLFATNPAENAGQKGKKTGSPLGASPDAV
jgi:hypothetical protein